MIDPRHLFNEELIASVSPSRHRAEQLELRFYDRCLLQGGCTLLVPTSFQSRRQNPRHHNQPPE